MDAAVLDRVLEYTGLILIPACEWGSVQERKKDTDQFWFWSGINQKWIIAGVFQFLIFFFFGGGSLHGKTTEKMEEMWGGDAGEEAEQS